MTAPGSYRRQKGLPIFPPVVAVVLAVMVIAVVTLCGSHSSPIRRADGTPDMNGTQDHGICVPSRA